jgi:hypothetical protein
VTTSLPDVLKVSCAHGDASLHLARRHKPLTTEPRTLCGLPTHTTPPGRPYLSAGCVECSRVAVAVGIEIVRDTTHAFVSLRRVARGPGRD